MIQNATFEANQPQVQVAWRARRHHVFLLVDGCLRPQGLAVAAWLALNGAAARMAGRGGVFAARGMPRVVQPKKTAQRAVIRFLLGSLHRA